MAGVWWCVKEAAGLSPDVQSMKEGDRSTKGGQGLNEDVAHHEWHLVEKTFF